MKKKVDLLIKGDLIINSNGGGAYLFQCKDSRLAEYFDITNSAVINGDLTVDSIDSAELVIVVTGHLVVKGGNHASS